MRKSLTLASIAFLFAPICVATSIARPTFAGEPDVLQDAQASAVFKQCSRLAPTPSHILPAPTSAEIDRLERVVERHIAVEYESNRPSPPGEISYGRQYVAYLEGGRRKIYGNYFPASLPGYRRGEAVVVCDGGPQFWGIVFDPEKASVASIAFNGNG